MPSVSYAEPHRPSRSRRPLSAPAAAAIAVALLIGAVLLLRFGMVVLALPVVAAGGLLLVLRPGWCLGFYAAVLVLFEQSGGSVIPGAWAYTERFAGLSIAFLIFGLMVVAVAVDVVRRRRVVSLQPAIAIGVGLLVCGMLAGAVTARSAGIGTSELYDKLLALLPLVAVPIAVHATLHSAERVRTALAVVAGLVLFKAAVGVVAVLGHLSTPDAGLGTDGSGARLTYYEPTVNWLSLGMLLVGVSALLRRVQLPAWVWAGMPLVVLSLLLSYRRSFWIATVLGVLIVLLFGASRLQRRLAVPAAALVAVALWATFSLGGVTEELGGTVVDRAASLNPTEVVVNRQDRYRLDERSNVLAELRAHPVAGLGIGVPWTAEVPLPIENVNGRQYVHFAFLWFWLKLGIIGAAAYVVLFVGGASAGLVASRRHPDALLACVGLGLFGAYFGLALAESTATFVGADSRFSAVFAGVLGLASRLGTARASDAPTR